MGIGVCLAFFRRARAFAGGACGRLQRPFAGSLYPMVLSSNLQYARLLAGAVAAPCFFRMVGMASDRPFRSGGHGNFRGEFFRPRTACGFACADA